MRYLIVALGAMVLAGFSGLGRCSDSAEKVELSREKVERENSSALRSDQAFRKTRGEEDRDAVALINKQLDLMLSESSEDVSLEEVRSACQELISTASIIDLLYHPQLGWKIFVGDSATGSSHAASLFAVYVHQALFERWGELDFEGALKRLAREGPIGGKEGYDGRWNVVAYLFKGGASVDGKAAFEHLLPARYSETQGVMLGPLMEGWASSDWEGAWAMITCSPALENGMANAWEQSLEGFFKGLPRETSWGEVRDRIEERAASNELWQGATEEAEMRRGLAKAWVKADPEAALSWFAPYAADSRRDWSAMDTNQSIYSYAEVLYIWLEEEPEKSVQWLASWQTEEVPLQKIYQVLYDRASHLGRGDKERAARMREALNGLIEEKGE